MFMSCRFLSMVIKNRKHCSPYLDYMYTYNPKKSYLYKYCTDYFNNMICSLNSLCFIEMLRGCLYLPLDQLCKHCMHFNFLLRVHADLILHWIWFGKLKFQIFEDILS